MAEKEGNEREDRIWRLSLTSLALAAVIMVGLGMLGGFLAMQIWTPPFPLGEGGETTQLVSTTREVTISPNKAVAEVVDETQRSIVLLANTETEAVLATGIVLTNDGLIAAPILPAGIGVTGIDFEGRKLALNRVGGDELYGIEFLRMTNAILAPVDIRREPILVGEEVLFMTRLMLGARLKAQKWQLQEYALPPELDAPPAVQQWLKGESFNDVNVNSGVLIDEEGKLAGILAMPKAGLAIKATDVEKSVLRLAQGQREDNIFEQAGLETKFTFGETEEGAMKFGVQVVAVAVNSPAAKATLRKGDLIIAVNGESLVFGGSFPESLKQTGPLTLTIVRSEKEIEARLNIAE